MKISKQLILFLIVLTGMVSVNSYAGKDEKVFVCHKTQSNNDEKEQKVVLLLVSEKAAIVHKELHGDTIGFEDCAPPPPPPE
jgi:hypothetical protein